MAGWQDDPIAGAAAVPQAAVTVPGQAAATPPQPEWMSDPVVPSQTAPSAAGPSPKPFNVLPFSEDQAGKVHFDPHAGVLGSVLDAFNAPGDAYQGKFDPFSPEGERRALNMATVISPVNPAVRAGDFAIPGVAKNLMQETPAAPAAAALKEATTAGYDAVKATGATYPGQAVGAFATNAVKDLNDEGFIAEIAPQTHAVLGKLANPPDGSTITLTNLDAARKSLGRVAGNFQNPTEQAASSRAINQIDDFISNSGQNAGASTPESEAARLIQEARGNAAAGFRSDRITGVEDAAQLRAAAANSGQNTGNALRSRITSMLLDPKQTRGFSPEELAAARQVVEGTTTSNALRYTGNMLGGGGGLGHSLVGAGGAVAGGLLGGAEGAGVGAVTLPLVGSAATHGANLLVNRQVNALNDLIRKRSPLYQQTLRDTPYTTANPGVSTAITNKLIPLSSMPQSQPSQ